MGIYLVQFQLFTYFVLGHTPWDVSLVQEDEQASSR